MSEKYEFEPEPLTDQQRKDLLARFVLGTPLPEGYGEAEHDDFMDACPMPSEAPEDY